MFGRSNKDSITLKDVPADAFIKAYAEHLKKTQKVIPMANYSFLKTGHSREIVPHDADWFYTRCAALARKLFLRPGLGVGTLQHIFGKKENNGHRRRHHSKGSGKVLRYALQQLEEADVMMRYNDKRNHSVQMEMPRGKELGYPRVMTPEGQKELNEIAKQVYNRLYTQDAE
jgi:small subunit ribosomal protein S19e